MHSRPQATTHQPWRLPFRKRVRKRLRRAVFLEQLEPRALLAAILPPPSSDRDIEPDLLAPPIPEPDQLARDYTTSLHLSNIATAPWPDAGSPRHDELALLRPVGTSPQGDVTVEKTPPTQFDGPEVDGPEENGAVRYWLGSSNDSRSRDWKVDTNNNWMYSDCESSCTIGRTFPGPGGQAIFANNSYSRGVILGSAGNATTGSIIVTSQNSGNDTEDLIEVQFDLNGRTLTAESWVNVGRTDSFGGPADLYVRGNGTTASQFNVGSSELGILHANSVLRLTEKATINGNVNGWDGRLRFYGDGGTINGEVYGNSDAELSFGANATIGKTNSNSGVIWWGTTYLNGNTATLNDSGQASLLGTTHMSGGTFNTPKGLWINNGTVYLVGGRINSTDGYVELGPSGSLRSHGVINGSVRGDIGSLIDVYSDNLSLGDFDNDWGLDTRGSLDAGIRNVTIDGKIGVLIAGTTSLDGGTITARSRTSGGAVVTGDYYISGTWNNEARDGVIIGNGTVAARIHGNEGALIIADGGTLRLGDANDDFGFSYSGILSTGSNTVELRDDNFAYSSGGVLVGYYDGANFTSNGTINTLDGNASGGLDIGNGSLVGRGWVNARIAGGSNAGIAASGGTLYLGDSGFTDGVSYFGSLNTNDRTVVLRDKDYAYVSGGVQLGYFDGTSFTANGIITANNGLNIANGILLGRGEVNGRFLAYSNSTLALGGNTSIGAGVSDGFSTTGTVSLNNWELTVSDSDFADFGKRTEFGVGGKIVPTTGVRFSSGDTIVGTGAVDGDVDLQSPVFESFGALTVGSKNVYDPNAIGPNIIIVEDGGTLTARGILPVRFFGNPGTTLTATEDLTIGDAQDPLGFTSQGTFNVGDHLVKVRDSEAARLGTLTTIAGGTLESDVTVAVAAGSTLRGHGFVLAPVGAVTGASPEATFVEASGGNLTLGNTSLSTGVNYLVAKLILNGRTITFADEDAALFGGAIDFGNSGILDATNELVLIEPTTFEGTGEIRAPLITLDADHGISVAANAVVTAGDVDSELGVVLLGDLDVGANASLTLRDSNLADVGARTTLAGGTLVAPNGVRFGLGERLTGNGSIVGEARFQPEAILSPGASPGILTISDLTMESGARFQVDLGKVDPESEIVPLAGIDYDQVRIGNSITLNDAILEITLLDDFVPEQGTTFTIVAQEGTAPVEGTFRDLPAGGIVVVDGLEFKISYVGGDGNDIVLTRAAPLPIGFPGVAEMISVRLFADNKDEVDGSFDPGDDPGMEIYIQWNINGFTQEALFGAVSRLDVVGKTGPNILRVDYNGLLGETDLEAVGFSSTMPGLVIIFTGQSDDGDRLEIIGDATNDPQDESRIRGQLVGTYTPDGILEEAGVVHIGTSQIEFSGLTEIEIREISSLTMTSPTSQDNIAIREEGGDGAPTVQIIEPYFLARPFVPLRFYNVDDFIFDATAAETAFVAVPANERSALRARQRVSAYSIDSSPTAAASFVDISGTGNPLVPDTSRLIGTGTVPAGNGYDEAVQWLDLAGQFSFDLYGQTYDSLSISLDGLIGFGAPSVESRADNQAFSFLSGPALAVFWDDLVSRTLQDPASNVFWQLFGEEGQKRLVIQWNELEFDTFGNNEIQFVNTDPITFQVVLHQADNSIQLVYRDIESTHASSSGVSATTAIKDAGINPPRQMILALNDAPNAAVANGLTTVLTPQPLFRDIDPAVGGGGIPLSFSDNDEDFVELAPGDLSGFTFPLDGQTYDSLFVGTNGLVSFGNGIASGSHTNLRSDPPEALIAPLWGDLALTEPTANVFWKLDGPDGQQVLTLQWHDVTLGANPPITFQAILKQATGEVEFNYFNVGASTYDSAAYAVGVKPPGSAEHPDDLIVLADDQHRSELVGAGKSVVIMPAQVAEFDDITATGTPFLAADLSSGNHDDGFVHLPSTLLNGFTFDFFSQTFDDIFISTNGLLTFGAGNADYANRSLDALANPTIAALWDDLIVPGLAADASPEDLSRTIYWQVLGEPTEDQQLVIQWNEVEYFASSEPITFQAVLSEADGAIDLLFRDLHGNMPGRDNGESATVGTTGGSGATLQPLHVSVNERNHAEVRTDGGVRLVPNTAFDHRLSVQSPIGLNADQLASFTIRTGIGDDQLVLEAGSFDVGSDHATFTIDAGDGVDRVILKGAKYRQYELTDTNLTNIMVDNVGSADSLGLVSVEAVEISGRATDDVFDASRFSGDVLLEGGGGSDTLYASRGTSRLYGEARVGGTTPVGDDIFHVHDVFAVEIFDGVGANDVLDLSGISAGGVNLDLDAVDIAQALPNGGTLTFSGTTGGAIESVIGTDFDDTFHLHALDVERTIRGGNIRPSVVEFRRQDPLMTSTDVDMLVFRAVFSEPVLHVDPSDFIPAGTTATVVDVVQVSPEVFDLTVMGGDLDHLNGTVGVDLRAITDITDVPGNALLPDEPPLDETYQLVNSVALAAIRRQSPSLERTNADELVFRAVFNLEVKNVDAADFEVDSDSSAAITAVTAIDARQYEITVSGGDLADFDGALGINLANGQDITDLSDNPLPLVEPTLDESYQIDNTPPTLLSFGLHDPTASPTNADVLTFRATFAEGVHEVDATDFMLDPSTTTTASITALVAVDATTYELVVSGGDLASYNGTVGIDLAVDQNIIDLAGNPLPPGEPAVDESYTVTNSGDSAGDSSEPAGPRDDIPATESDGPPETQPGDMLFYDAMGSPAEIIDNTVEAHDPPLAKVHFLDILPENVHLLNLNADPVPNAGPDGNAVEGAPFTRAVSFTDFGGNAWTVSVNYNDGTPVDDFPAPGNEFTIMHHFPDDGTYTVDVTVRDNYGAAGQDSFTIVVENADPTLTVVPDQAAIVGQELAIPDLGTISDPGFGPEEVFGYVIDWGDGSEPSVGTATVDSAGGPGSPTRASFDGTHVYAASGTYTVTVTVVDDEGSDSKTFVVHAAEAFLSIDDVSISEAAGVATFTIGLAEPSTVPITVEYSTADGTATAGADYTAVTATTLTFQPGEISKTVEIAIEDDALDESDETFLVHLAAAVNARIIDGMGQGTIIDDDAPPAVSIDDVSVAEDAADATFTVTLSSPSAKTLSVDYVTANGTAIGGSDYVAIAATTVTFAPGEISKTVTVSLLDDALDEDDETFQVLLSNPSNVTIADGVGVATITDDDPLPAVSITGVSVSESAESATFTVTLSAPSGRTVSVDYATSDGSATAGTDYVAISATTLSFAPGETSKTIAVAIHEDALDEDDETFQVSLSNPLHASINTGSAVGTITDNDDAPTLSIDDVSVNENGESATFTVTLGAASGKTVSFDFTTENISARAGEDYTGWDTTTLTLQPGETSRSISIVIADDALDEDDETFRINLSNPVNTTLADAIGIGTILDNDTPPGLSIDDTSIDEDAGTATFTVSLSAASGRAVSIDYSTMNGSAIAGEDYGMIGVTTLTFAPGRTAQTFTVPIFEDALDEDDESFHIVLENPTNATVADGMGTATILDNDPMPSLSISDSIVDEDAGTAVFTVDLSAASGREVSLRYATSDGSATAGSDYDAISDGIITFPPGTTRKTLAVTITEDGLDEVDETFVVTLASPTNATIGDGAGVGTIRDNDAAPALSIDDVTIDESAQTATFTVTLSAASGKQITVEYSTADDTAVAGSDYTAISPTVLTFGAGETAKTLNVTIREDTQDEADETFRVILTSPVHATLGDGLGVGTIIDNDATNPSQHVYAADASVAPGDTVSVPVRYRTLDPAGDPSHQLATGLGLRLHFDSTKLTFDGLQLGVTEAHLTTSGATADSGDYDQDSSTDSFVIVAWSDFGLSNGGWPSESSQPAILYTAMFTAAAGFDTATQLNFSASSRGSDPTTSLQFEFQPGPATISPAPVIPSIAIDDVVVDEGAGTATFTVSLSAASTETVTVDYATSDVTATAGDDYSPINSTTLSFAPGETSKNISVTILEDSIDESDETFHVALTNPANATLGDATGVGTIQDNDVTTPAQEVSAVDKTVAPGTQFAVPVIYRTLDANGNPSNQLTTGLGLRLHFDSSKLTFDSLSLGVTEAHLTTSAATADTGDFDGDPSTDRFVIVAWSDFGLANGGWPSESAQPATLYTATFTTAADFSAATNINFSASSRGADPVTSQPLDFRADSATISPTPTISAQLDYTVGREATTTGANGEVTSLPSNADFIHEWEPYYVEVWASTGGSTTDVTEASFDLAYDTIYTTATAIEAGPAFTLHGGTINDATGRVENVDVRTTTTGLGEDMFLLLARIRFEPSGADQAPVDEVAHQIGPYDLALALSDSAVIAAGEDITPTIGDAPSTELWAVPYDVDDNNQIDFGDYAIFTPAFGRAVGGDEPPYTWWADFDQSGLVDFGDFAYFTPNFGKSRGEGPIVLPANFAPRGAGNADSITSGGENDAGEHQKSGDHTTTATTPRSLRDGVQGCHVNDMVPVKRPIETSNAPTNDVPSWNAHHADTVELAMPPLPFGPASGTVTMSDTPTGTPPPAAEIRFRQSQGTNWDVADRLVVVTMPPTRDVPTRAAQRGASSAEVNALFGILGSDEHIASANRLGRGASHSPPRAAWSIEDNGSDERLRSLDMTTRDVDEYFEMVGRRTRNTRGTQ